MNSLFRSQSLLILIALTSVCFSFLVSTPTHAQPTPTINYQGKLTDAAGLAVTDGTYNMRFWLLQSTGQATTSAVWSEELTGTDQVTVTNGLFSVMLGSTSPLTSVDFDQPLYLGVEIGGTGAAAWDGEMSPRKPLGTVPAAFAAYELGGVASSSFLRSDEADTVAATTASTLLTINQSGAGDILNLLDGGTEVFTVTDGGNVGIGTTTPDSLLTVNGDINISATTSSLMIGGMPMVSIADGQFNAFSNTFFGSSASSLDTLASTYNTFVGRINGSDGDLGITTGSGNSAVGSGALRRLQSGSNNTAMGASALTSLLTEGSNTSVGAYSGNSLVFGSGNVFMGNFTGFDLATSSNSTIIGAQSYGFNGTDFEANNVTTLGYRAGYLAETGADNNILLGYQAADSLTTGANNIIIGYDVEAPSNTGDNQLNIGNLIFGTGVDGTGTTLSGGSVGIGTSTPDSLLTVNGDINISATTSALMIGGISMVSVADAQFSSFSNTFFGSAAPSLDTTQSSYNTFVGRESSFGGNLALTTGTSNSALGSGALNRILTGDRNTAVGASALRNLTTENDNTAFGYFAGNDLVSGVGNLFVGGSAGRDLATSSYSTIIGTQSYGVSGSAIEANNVTTLGYRAGYLAETGADNNILLGYQAADSLTTGANNIIIGYDVEAPSNTGDNQLNIGNLIFGTGVDGTGTTLSGGSVGIGTSTPSAKLTVAGNLRVTGAFADSASSTGTIGQILQTTGSGTQWVATSSLGFNDASLFTDDGTSTYLTSLTDNLAIGTTTAELYSSRLAVVGTSTFMGSDTSDYNWTNGALPDTFAARIGLDDNGNGLLIKQGASSGQNRYLAINDRFGSELFSVSSGGVALGSEQISMLGGFNSGRAFNLSFVDEESVIAGAATDAGALLIVDDRIDLTADDRTVPLVRFSRIVPDGSTTPTLGESLGGINAVEDGVNRGLALVTYSSSTDTFSENMRILSNGRVGIGTSTPTVALDLVGAQNITSSAGNALNLESNSAAAYLNINNTNTGVSALRFQDGGSTRWTVGNDGNDSDSYKFSASSALGTSDRLTIMSTGNIGIGTTTPYAELSVVGGIALTGGIYDNTASLGTSGMVLQSDGTGVNWVATSSLGISGGGSSLTVGSDNQVPFSNSGGTDFDYSGNLTFDGSTLSVQTTASDDILNLFETSGAEVFTVQENGAVGIGTTSPQAQLSIDVAALDGASIAALDQYVVTENTVENAIQYGNRFFLDANNTATTTIVGSMYRLADDTAFGNTVRGLEVQTNRGANTNGENTALSGFARTFGVRGVTSADAGADFEPAGGFFETEGTTQGNAVRAYSGSITTASLLSLFQDTSDFTGTGLEMNFGNTTGDFSSTSSKYLDFQNAGTSVFTVSAFGTTTIGDGTTNNMAGLQIGYGGICVDNDGSCTASTTGQISSVSSFTGNSDLAEMYFSDQDLAPGEIVTLAGELSVERAQQGAALPIIGVVSTKPGLTLGFDDVSTRPDETGYPLALKGRVPVMLSTENGPIEKGDQLMLSSLPGIAMKATGTGAVVGIALEDFNQNRMYSDTFINQFGDDMVDPIYEPVFTNTDPRINDGCYYSGGAAAGEAPCVPLVSTTTAGQIGEVNDRLEAASVAEQIEALADQRSDRRTLANGDQVRVGQVVMFVHLQERFLDETQLAQIDLLRGTSSLSKLGEDESETVLDRLIALADRFVDGVFSVLELRADRVEVAEELCVDGVCLGADDIRALLDGAAATTEVVDDEDDDVTEPIDQTDPVDPTDDIDTATTTSTSTDQTNDNPVDQMTGDTGTSTPDQPEDTASSTSPQIEVTDDEGGTEEVTEEDVAVEDGSQAEEQVDGVQENEPEPEAPVVEEEIEEPEEPTVAAVVEDTEV